MGTIFDGFEFFVSVVVLVPSEMGPGEFVLDTRFDGEVGVPDERLGHPYEERSEHLTKKKHTFITHLVT